MPNKDKKYKGATPLKMNKAVVAGNKKIKNHYPKKRFTIACFFIAKNHLLKGKNKP